MYCRAITGLAVSSCGEDTACIKEFLYGFDGRETIAGTVSIDENGDTRRPFVAMIFENGAKVPAPVS